MQSNRPRGISLVEVLIASAVFVMVGTAVYGLYVKSLQFVSTSRSKIAATALASELFETIRNLPYSDVGIISGVPSGKIKRVQTFVRDNFTFIATTSIRNIDDYFDGTVTTTPRDTAPADYKAADVTILCVSCRTGTSVGYTTLIAPSSIEASTTNGTLLVQALDATGLPVSGATVRVVHSAASIDVTEITNAQGVLQLVGVPPANQKYAITVSKSGYSTDRNYLSGGAGNPTPIKPYATVASSTLTQTSFLIDELSSLEVSSVTNQCVAVPDFDFSLRGTKLIGTPSVYKYATTSFVTDSTGVKSIPNIEWDTYSVAGSDTSYDLAGTIPLFSLALPPDTNQTVKLITAPKTANALLVSVTDSVTGLPISGALVTISNGTPDAKYTERGALFQTDWSGGSGQEDVGQTNQFLSADGGIETSAFPGEVRLKSILGSYTGTGELISSVFDAGSNASFFDLRFSGTEPASTSIRFQIATATTSSATTTWNYFGPDATASSYYTSATGTIPSIHTNDQYIRYKLLLATASSTITPKVNDISVTFTSSCTPPGQVFWSGLSSGTYTISVSKAGYNTYGGSIGVTSAWQSRSVPLVSQ